MKLVDLERKLLQCRSLGAIDECEVTLDGNHLSMITPLIVGQPKAALAAPSAAGGPDLLPVEPAD